MRNFKNCITTTRCVQFGFGAVSMKICFKHTCVAGWLRTAIIGTYQAVLVLGYQKEKKKKKRHMSLASHKPHIIYIPLNRTLYVFDQSCCVAPPSSAGLALPVEYCSVASPGVCLLGWLLAGSAVAEDAASAFALLAAAAWREASEGTP